MREFWCRPGTKYEGVHNLYENMDEFKKYLPNAKVFLWSREDCTIAEVGDWVMAEDGYIVQILQKNLIPNKAFPGRDTWAVRFPMGTFAINRRADGSMRYAQFYGQFTCGDKHSLSHAPKTSRSKDLPKLQFAAAIMAGMEPYRALRMTFPECRRYMTPVQISNKIRNLFMDEIVGDEIKKHVTAFKDDLKERVTMKDILENLEKHWKAVKPGTPQFLPTVKFFMEAHDILASDSRGKQRILNKADEAEDANIIAESAPMLGQKEDH